MSIRVAKEGMLLGRLTSTQTATMAQPTSPVVHREELSALEQTQHWPAHDGKAVFGAGF
jgi:hypothetical protein